MSITLDLVEPGVVPDPLVRFGIRRLLRQRPGEEDRGSAEAQERALREFEAELRSSPIALHADAANEQHHELPPAFFEACVGPHLKYSSCYSPKGTESLAEAERGISNLEVLSADMNAFGPGHPGADESGGSMHSHDLLLQFDDNLALEERRTVDGTHYARTSEHRLQNPDARRAEVLPVLRDTYGPASAAKWSQRWRVFFLSCAELFGYANGSEWWVSHYRFRSATTLN